MATGEPGLFSFVLSIVRDFALTDRVMREAAPRETVLEMSRGGRDIALSPGAVEALSRADREDPADGWLEAVRQCLEGADRRTRSLLAMRYRGGLGVAEISRRTKTPPAPARESLSRARAALARCVEGRLGRPGTSMKPLERFDEMVSNYFDGALDADGLGELGTLVAARPEYATRFVRLSRLHGGLRELQAPPPGPGKPPRRVLWVAVIAAAAAAVLFFALLR